MPRISRTALLWMLLVGLSSPASAAPAMFSASLILHAFGNDVTTGSSWPSNTSVFYALPLGHDCRDPSKYTASGALAPYHCGATTLRAGRPATGAGTLVVGTGSPASLALPQSVIGITTVGARPLQPGYLQSDTYATFVNAPGLFFAGGGPQSVSRYYGCGEIPSKLCPLVVENGPNRFGGAMPLLGRLGAAVKWVNPGVSGTFSGTSSWNMIVAPGRRGFYGDPLNPYTNTGMFYNAVLGATYTVSKYGQGTLWTTGMVGVYAEVGYFTTILRRTGYDDRTPGGLGNLQLVTPALTRWNWPGSSPAYTGHIGILRLQVPEPGAVLLLAAGAGVLAALRRLGRRD